ncbi:fatty acyl-AMP ligase [Desulfoluna butyratoxydans]|uniref:Amp-dependent synthetase/ligase n=1 Tax=Desulfoluna butyratoxydans TaxID=231438 RepID=A0A4V6ILQ7_9BACT|nr:fatty acyl-AMP ligase [Desulfoluna butyratoxydans]VFQ46098.1 amp-dependent synthetase/ligase [Desulfoluna butyratoxydans]
MSNLIRALQEKAVSMPEKKAFVSLGRDGSELASISFRELDAQARCVAFRLQSMGLSGRPMVMLMENRISLVVGFLGCIYAGVIPVPMPVPRHGRSWQRVRAVAGDSGADHLLADRHIVDRIARSKKESLFSPETYRWISVEDLASEGTGQWTHIAPDPHDLAFLQYTSGSTGTPKGVMISHGNLLENTLAFSRHFGLSRQSVSVSWLPLFHDMGLVAHVVQPVVLGCTSVLLDPLSFIMKPVSWLRAMSTHGGTFSGAPNFAYELCAREIPDRDVAGLDLSSWSTAYSGSEPVRRSTLELFYARFKSAGFRRTAFSPGYGLAEATLIVSVKPAGKTYVSRGHSKVRKAPGKGHLFLSGDMISCGSATGDHQIRIVDPDSGVDLNDGEIGEIWVSGSSVAKGYWKNPGLTAQFFVRGDNSARLWFRTGDLGLLEDGELYVAGRLKDVLIINGENYFAEDMEHTISMCHEGFRSGGCALFPVETGHGEHPVAACEIASEASPETRQDMVEAACRAVMETHEIPLYDLVFSLRGKLPRTTSGKIKRHRCRQQYMDRRLALPFGPSSHPSLIRNRMEESHDCPKSLSSERSLHDSLVGS